MKQGSIGYSFNAVFNSLYRFEKLVREIRAPFPQYRGKDGKDEDRTKHFNRWLHFKFSDNGHTKGEVYNAWNYDIFTMTYGKLEVCKLIFGALYGITATQISYVQKQINNGIVPEMMVPDNKEPCTLKEAFQSFGLDFDLYITRIENFVQMDQIPDTRKGLQCVAFLCQYFALCGDNEPNANQVHLSMCEKKDVYEEYISDDVIIDSGECYCLTEFRSIWKNVFPQVKIRKWKNVEGKCNFCECFQTLLKTTRVRSDREILKQYRLMHRAYYMGEKLEYYKRVREAVDSCGLVWSFIIDGMSSYSTQLPIQGHAAQMSKKFETHIEGCIFHTQHETTFYWSYPNVHCGASLIIHCMFLEIEHRMQDVIAGKIPMPTKIYVQIDGASDNVAKAVYASMEHLVFKKLCPQIIVCRLPTGHTHEDVDSKFGVVYVSTRGDHIYTPQQFEAAILGAFGNCSNVRVIPVTAICDFKEYYDKFIDKDLIDHFSKGDTTQHIFKIESLRDIDEDEAVSNGLLVRTNYKKSSQEVCLNLRRCRNENEDEYNPTPFVPEIIRSAYIPECASEESGDRVCGISFLCKEPTGLPDLMEFKPWRANYDKFINVMQTEFSATPSILLDWRKFERKYLPPSDDVEDYKEQAGGYNIPLKKYLFTSTQDFSNVRRPRGFHADSMEVRDDSRLTAFEGENVTRASIFDLSLQKHLRQDSQSIEWRGKKTISKNWQFNHKNVMDRILMER